MTTRLQKQYQSVIVPQLMQELGLKNPMQVPKIEKITINMGVGEAVADKKLIDNAVGVTRRVISDLHPTILDDLGMIAALEWQCGQFSKRTGIACKVNGAEEAHDKDDEGQLDKTQAINLFRIFQEALTNVAQHSGATSVNVEFHQGDDEIILTISDNGCGLPREHVIAQTSYGLRGMRERVAQLDGQILFDSPPGGGLRVTVILPVADERDREGAT